MAKELAWKASRAERPRGFESHVLRQKRALGSWRFQGYFLSRPDNGGCRGCKLHLIRTNAAARARREECMLRTMIREKREVRRERVRNDLRTYGENVLRSEEMRKAFEQTHHRRSTVGEHTLRVASASVMICYALKKLNVEVSVPAVVVGALCHDLGILGRKEKYSSERECLAGHAKDSVLVAKGLMEELPDKTEDIIERHMWPVGESKAPNSIEGVIVSVADKYSALRDVLPAAKSPELSGW